MSNVQESTVAPFNPVSFLRRVTAVTLTTAAFAAKPPEQQRQLAEAAVKEYAKHARVSFAVALARWLVVAEGNRAAAILQSLAKK